MRRALFKTTVRFWAAFGFLNTIVGFAGLTDDVTRWADWIGAMMDDPTVMYLATRAVTVAEFVNQGWFRICLVVSGILMIIWPLRWFWRLRHRLVFRWRRLLADQVWISRNEAMKLVSNSQWALVREPAISIFDAMSLNMLRHGMSPAERQKLKFHRLCEMMLEQFETHNKEFTRLDESNQILFSESDLRDHLKKAYDKDVTAEFGELPNPY